MIFENKFNTNIIVNKVTNHSFPADWALATLEYEDHLHCAELQTNSSVHLLSYSTTKMKPNRK